MNKRLTATALFLSSVLVAASLSAAVRLPGIVGDGMILQRDAALKIWGWADPGEHVTVTFRGDHHDATADANGRWQIALPALKAGGPDDMEIAGTNRITLHDVLVGDVWLCGGQSNMTHTFVRWTERYAKEIAASDNPAIRQFLVPTKAVLTGPLDDIPGLSWKPANPKNLLDFTVIGYFFAKKLYDRYHVPQGIIMDCVGGTPIEAWTSEEGFKDFPAELATIAKNKDTAYVEKTNADAKAAREAAGPRGEPDAGLAGPVKWSDPSYDAHNWREIGIPGYWEDQGVRNLDGVVWYRREIDVPAAMTGVEALVKLGRIVDADELYINGRKVGETGYQYPRRRYTIPAGVLKPGKNLFVIRVTNQFGKGGFVPDKPYYVEAAGQRIDLKGYWQYRVGTAYRPFHGRFVRGISAQDQPASLYNGMIAPYTNYAVRGMLWYQGESNAGHPEPYYQLLPNLVADWRRHWGLGDALFLIVQLPGYGDIDYLPPAESGWAVIRDAELKTAQTTPRTGIDINIDLGEWNDLHPARKKEVGERLALQAMKLSYGDRDLVASGPIFHSQEIKDGKIILTFDDAGSGLTSSNGEPLAHFAIAGADRKFVWATAEIEGKDRVIVSSPEVPAPKFVRYAWADNPDFANLVNKEGLPASPFRTDK
ncbi:MAG TPA: sialate O-acetylesterase [Opitutus sp.]|nr:sialate O-acetylesterase [Opitutus sp.]